ncbi:UPF0280 family protein [Mesorhizobium sp. NBSH29]|uniref:UPF0280 family protein n=1 Tax=Mesorhizobium sp. NBSH29 TaxID=2654249 RepID=UPI001896533D|nr:UPF0280 family protein [Mesorhizobium sp. NBSH29]QPC88534.1 UPF0280 family protein [Mesorhizobium sp. NBSH29]
MIGPQARWLADGKRLHLNHGPIDLIIQAFGSPDDMKAAYAQAVARFQTVLGELAAELPELRAASQCEPRTFKSVIAKRMEQATSRHAKKEFITPMAAVAGSVADEVLSALLYEHSLERAYVNNGGDIAFFLAIGEVFHAAIAGTGHGFADRLVINAQDPIRGIATSGWRGRSHSLGIADAVTVVAATAAEADAGATLIANAVDLPGHSAVSRVPAAQISPDSDLSMRLVTTAVGVLSETEVASALSRGLERAEAMIRDGFIEGAALFLQGRSQTCGRPSANTLPKSRAHFSPGSKTQTNGALADA